MNQKRLLIPFGVAKEGGAYLDPENVPSGRACGCVCPGCHAPLICRHSKKVRYHFAHDTKHPNAVPEGECPLSSLVALVMMAKHLLLNITAKQFQLPPYLIEVRPPCCPYDRQALVPVSTVKSVAITASENDVLLGSMKFDTALSVGDHKLYVELNGPERATEELDYAILASEKAGVLSLNAYELSIAVSHRLELDSSEKYSEAVQACLVQADTKEWRYHPNAAAAHSLALQEHRCKQGIYRSEIMKAYAYRKGMIMVRCKACLAEWGWSHGMYRGCPHCNTDRYVVEIV